MIAEIISVMSPEELEALKSSISGSTTLVSKIIELTLQLGDPGKEEMMKHLGISESSYFKNLSLAKDEIYEVLKKTQHNSYDDIVLVQRLYMRGLEGHALKLMQKLEEKYEKQRWYGPLDMLYHEEVRIAYSKCDAKALEKLLKKVSDNLDRYHAYVLLDKELLLEMAVLEKQEIKDKDFAAHEKKLKAMLSRAVAQNHHVLRFNALHCLYTFHTRHSIQADAVNNIIKDIRSLLKEEEERIDQVTAIVGLYHVAAYRITFETKDSPDEYKEKLMENLHRFGSLFTSEILFSYALYYLLTNNSKDMFSMVEQLNKQTLEKSFDYVVHAGNALAAFAANDSKSFKRNQDLFYSSIVSRSFPEYELMLRYLEMVFLYREEEMSTLQDRIEAAAKFVQRNFSTSRYAWEKELFASFRKVVKGGKIQPDNSSPYRFNNYLLHSIHGSN